MPARAKQQPDYGVRPTPETKAKLKHDVLVRLYRQGLLLQRHVLAAEEIRHVLEAKVSAMFAPRELSGGKRPKHARGGTWLNRLLALSGRAWEKKYTPWSHQMAENCGRGTKLELVYDIIFENRGLRETEKRLGIQHGSAISVLKEALEAWPVDYV